MQVSTPHASHSLTRTHAASHLGLIHSQPCLAEAVASTPYPHDRHSPSKVSNPLGGLSSSRTTAWTSSSLPAPHLHLRRPPKPTRLSLLPPPLHPSLPHGEAHSCPKPQAMSCGGLAACSSPLPQHLHHHAVLRGWGTVGWWGTCCSTRPAHQHAGQHTPRITLADPRPCG